MVKKHPHARLRSFLVAKGLSQEEAARLLGCDQSTVSRALSGRPGFRVAAAIERATLAWEGGPIRAVEWLSESEMGR